MWLDKCSKGELLRPHDPHNYRQYGEGGGMGDEVMLSIAHQYQQPQGARLNSRWIQAV